MFTIITNDELFMYGALHEAKKSLKTGDIPVGALIVENDEVIAAGHNQVEQKQDPLAHAEIIAIQKAIKKIGYKHLHKCKMYVTLEPCSMCAGAIVLARIPELFFGAYDPKAGASGSVLNLTNHEKLNHKCNVIPGVLQDQCSKFLKDFFNELRKSKKK